MDRNQCNEEIPAPVGIKLKFRTQSLLLFNAGAISLSHTLKFNLFLLAPHISPLVANASFKRKDACIMPNMA